MQRTAHDVRCSRCSNLLAKVAAGGGVEVQRRGLAVARVRSGAVELPCPRCRGVVTVEVAPKTPHTLRVLASGE